MQYDSKAKRTCVFFHSCRHYKAWSCACIVSCMHFLLRWIECANRVCKASDVDECDVVLMWWEPRVVLKCVKPNLKFLLETLNNVMYLYIHSTNFYLGSTYMMPMCLQVRPQFEKLNCQLDEKGTLMAVGLYNLMQYHALLNCVSAITPQLYLGSNRHNN